MDREKTPLRFSFFGDDFVVRLDRFGLLFLIGFLYVIGLCRCFGAFGWVRFLWFGEFTFPESGVNEDEAERNRKVTCNE